MVTLFASIVGFVSSLIPEIVKFLKDKNDKKHELEIMVQQIEFSKSNLTQLLDEIKVKDGFAEQLTSYSTFKIGINWVDALNGTVRPVMAYCFFGLYSFLKYTQYGVIAKSADSIIEYVDILWSIDDQAIFAGIISFYFGQRTFSKLSKVK